MDKTKSQKKFDYFIDCHRSKNGPENTQIGYMKDSFTFKLAGIVYMKKTFYVAPNN